MVIHKYCNHRDSLCCGVFFGFLKVGFEDPIEDPILAVMASITLLVAPLIVILMASILTTSSQDRKIFGIITLTFGVIMTGLTSGVHGEKASSE